MIQCWCIVIFTVGSKIETKNTVKPVLLVATQKTTESRVKTDNRLSKAKSIAEIAPVEHSAVLLTCI